MKNAILLGLLVWATTASAVRLQILHTNDLHSFFEGTRDGQGGYAKLKTLADRLKAHAAADGVETVFLDGGDFGEGSSFFFSDAGADALRMLDLLGVDVTVIGNHDYMQGGRELSAQLKRAGLKAKVVSANLKGKFLQKLAGKVHPMVVMDVAGLRLGVSGLTTADLHYQYPVLGTGFINHPLNELPRLEKRARKAKLDMHIALTHIGLGLDRSLVQKSTGIDLVVGGHSHTRLAEPVLEKNKVGREVAIVQTGAHSLALGQILVDVEKGQAPKILSYKLHDVTSGLSEDPAVKRLVEDAKEKREAYFGRRWDEPVGESTFDLSGYRHGRNPGRTSCWGGHLAKITKDAAKADIGLHVAAFSGEFIPAGLLTFGDLVDNFPHFRNFGDRGWKISTFRLPGLLLKKVLAYVRANAPAIDLAGADFASLTVGGKTISPLKLYRLSFPNELLYAVGKYVPLLKPIIALGPYHTGVAYWDAIEAYVRVNSPLTCPAG